MVVLQFMQKAYALKQMNEQMTMISRIFSLAVSCPVTISGTNRGNLILRSCDRL